MTLPASGAISLNDVNVELDLSATAQIGMNDSAVRDLFDVPSGAISMSDGYGKSAYYTIERSLRFRSSGPAYLSKTYGAGSASEKYTFSFWVKRGKLGVAQDLLGADSGVAWYSTFLQFTASDTLRFWTYYGSSGTRYGWYTTQVFRDPSAWYHFVINVDTSISGQQSRRLWVNGTEVTSFTSEVSGYNSIGMNTYVFASGVSSLLSYTFDGYTAENHMVWGQTLDPTYFGEYNANIGAWQPIEYSGSYGTNGFYLNFSNNANTTALGYDYSGNGNNWTTNNISLTNDYTYDSKQDVPTLTSSIQANYAVVSVIDIDRGSITTSNGNLTNVKATDSTSPRAVSSMGVTSGKWYAEITWSSITDSTPYGDYIITGVTTKENWTPSYNGYNGVLYMASNPAGGLNGYKATYTNGSFVGWDPYGSGYWVNGSVIGIALDLDAGTVTFYNNGVSQGAITLPSTTEEWFIFCTSDGGYNGYTNHFNFGASEFTYSAPSGFKRMNTYNLPDSTIVDGGAYFNTVLYTGNGGNKSITGVGFRPDFVWGKLRSTSSYHRLHDVLRGSDNTLASNVTDAQVTGNGIVSFDSDGFTMDSGTNINQVYPYVAWNWKANGAGVSNGSGSITSTVSANTTAGFSIVSYTGNGSAGATIGHGLGVAPSMMIVKQKNAAQYWPVYHVGTHITPATGQAYLNTTNAYFAESTTWNNTAPTSSVFTVGTNLETNASGGSFIAYCFAQVEGYSNFGKYIGNGSSDGPFAYTGFRPAFVMIKRTDALAWWYTLDAERNTYNVLQNYLSANDSYGEYSNVDFFDFTSNGFKLRTSNSEGNASGGVYMYMAFAESPFKNSLAR